MNTLKLQCRAEIIKVLRNRYYVFWSLLMPIIFYYIFTNVVNTNVEDQAQWQAHYLMSMTTFSVMGSAIMTHGIRMVQERAQGWSTFIRITPLSDTVYFAAQMLAQCVIHVLSITVIFVAGALINDVSLTAAQWTLSGLWILCGSLPFLAIGTLVGMINKVETAAGISNVLYMVLAVTGGEQQPLEKRPKKSLLNFIYPPALSATTSQKFSASLTPKTEWKPSVSLRKKAGFNRCGSPWDKSLL